MKRGTPDHPKMLDLAEMIQVYLESQHGLILPFELAHNLTCGMIEKMWHYAARYSPDGGIGKHSDVRICRAIGWMHDAHWIVEAMTKVAFLDAREDCRLYVHDWHQHSDDAADKWLRDKGLCYCNGCQPRRRDSSEKPKSRQVKTRSRQVSTQSRQSEPEPEPSSESSSKPKPEPKSSSGALVGSGVYQTKISEEMLRDTGKLIAWLIAESLKPEPLISDSEQNRLFVVAIAERALDVGKSNPCGLFFKLIRDKERDFAGKYEDRAQARLKEFHRSVRGPASQVATPKLQRAT